VALTGLLHLLLISPLLLGTGHLARKVSTLEGGETSGVPAMTLIPAANPLQEAFQL